MAVILWIDTPSPPNSILGAQSTLSRVMIVIAANYEFLVSQVAD